LPARGRDPGGWWPEGDDGDRSTEGRGEDEEAAKTGPPRGLETPGTRRSTSRYSIFVGIAFVALILVAVANLLDDGDSGILGIEDDDEGLPLAEFAVPSLVGSVEADANVAQDDCESQRNPCPSDQARTPACEIDLGAANAIRVCDLFDRPLAISFWFTRGGDCLPSQDSFDEVASRYEGRVNFLSVNARDDRDDVEAIVNERGWELPVGLDADGAVANLYRVGGCPTFVLAYPGGILYRAEIGDRTATEIDGLVAELLAASRARASTSR